MALFGISEFGYAPYMLDRSPQVLRKPALPGPQQKVLFAEQRLRDAILWCEIAPGSLVTEAALGASFNLAKAATRTALARLAGEGLVQPITRKGWRVRPITGELIGGLIQARRLIEPSLADVRPGEAELLRINQLVPIIQALRRQTEPQSLQTARQYGRELLDLLAVAANPFMRRWLHELWDHTERTVRFLEGRGIKRLAVPDPAPLAAGLRAGDRQIIRSALLAAINDFESFAAKVLLSDPAEIATSGREPARKRGRQEPRQADRSAHAIIKTRGAYS
jgi:DNA-binding GntR family transcriptional regulator